MAMKVECPSCKQEIPAAAINLGTDMAVCPACGKALRSSESAGPAGPTHGHLGQPPPGTWFFTQDDSWQVGASTRSWAVFAATGVLSLLFGGASMLGAGPMDPRFGAFNFVLATPLYLFTGVLVVAMLMTVAGKVTVTVSGDRGVVFTGIGLLGQRRRFRWSEIACVEEEVLANTEGGFTMRLPVVALVGNTRIRFGTMLSPQRRQFIIEVLREILAGTSGGSLPVSSP